MISQDYILCYCAASKRPSSASVPGLSLTMPTPGHTHSPVFMPHSPFSLSKFVAASAMSHSISERVPHPPAPPRANTSNSLPTILGSPVLQTVSSRTRSPVPTPLQCEECTDVVPCSNTCRRQWLACAAWYQANDGGRRQWLVEPYIHAAESTTATRNLLDQLGLPVGGPRGLGLMVAIADDKSITANSHDVKNPSINGKHARSSSTAASNIATAYGPAHTHLHVSKRRRIWNSVRSLCSKRRPRTDSVSSERSLPDSLTKSAVEVHVSTVQEVC
jgi:hypothetical protein